MLTVYFRKYRTIILIGVFFFYLGSCITISFTRTDCSVSTKNLNLKTQNEDLVNAKYIVLIVSSPNNEAKRDAIRATWANLVNNIFIVNGEIIYMWNHTRLNINSHKNVVKLYFVVGIDRLKEVKVRKLEIEKKHRNDMLLLDNVEDSYKNLSLKILNALKWINKNVQGMEYVIKCDDDSFLRIDLIIKDLEDFAPSMNAPVIRQFVTFKEKLPSYKGLYWGYFNGKAKVYLNGKWQERDWFLCDNYLPYALGGGYVISHIIVHYIANNSDLLSTYNSEDVSMGVWTAALNSINRVHDIRFDTEWQSRGCVDTMLVRHKQIPSDMFQMYKMLVHSHGEKLCDIEGLKRNSYLYNWKALPSMCCTKRQS